MLGLWFICFCGVVVFFCVFYCRETLECTECVRHLYVGLTHLSEGVVPWVFFCWLGCFFVFVVCVGCV